jgi:hypothetical protein
VIAAVIITPPGCCWKFTVPAVLVPLLGWSVAVALALALALALVLVLVLVLAPDALAADEEVLPEPAQPASAMVAAMQAARGVSTCFIGLLFLS